MLRNLTVIDTVHRAVEEKPNCFEDIIAGAALYRPGPMDFIPDYIKGKHHPEDITYLVPELEEILSRVPGW